MFELFADDARGVVVHAGQECRRAGQPSIGPEHVLLGILRTDSDVRTVLDAAGLTLDWSRAHLAPEPSTPSQLGRGEPYGHLPFSDSATAAFQAAVRACGTLGSVQVRQPHLLLGVLDSDDGAIVSALLARGADLAALVSAAETLGGPRFDAVAGAGAHRAAGTSRHRAADDAQNLDEVAAGLMRYGRHDDDCDLDPCSCGLGPLLQRWAE